MLIRDVAYEMLPKAVRARKHAEVGEFIRQRVGDRDEGSVALVASTTVARRRSPPRPTSPRARPTSCRGLALRYREAAGDAAASLYSNREALFHYESATALLDGEVETAQRIAEKSGDVALRLGRVDPAIELWEGCWSTTPAAETARSSPGELMAGTCRPRISMKNSSPRFCARAFFLICRHRLEYAKPLPLRLRI